MQCGDGGGFDKFIVFALAPLLPPLPPDTLPAICTHIIISQIFRIFFTHQRTRTRRFAVDARRRRRRRVEFKYCYAAAPFGAGAGCVRLVARCNAQNRNN